MPTLRDRLQAGSDDLLQLVKGRVHEVEGRGRTGFALYHAARLAGPIFWIVLAHDRDRPMPGGVTERLHFIEARSETDLLWTVEEALGNLLGRRGQGVSGAFHRGSPFLARFLK